MTRVSLEAARSHWARGQGLSARVASPGDAVSRSGWLRTLGGIDVYLALGARSSAGRAAVDALVTGGELRVSMALRSCIYLVPRIHAAAALRLADGLWRKRTDRDLVRAGTTWKEVDDVGAAVVTTLRSRGALGTDALRRAMPEGVVRSLGEKGKKAGLSSPLPVSLRDLELRGVIERTLPAGKLDSEGYLWRAAERSVLAMPGAPRTAQDALAATVALAVGWLGPVTLAELADWIGSSQRDVRASLASLELAEVEVDGKPGAHLVLRAALPQLREGAPIPETEVRLLAFEDNLLVTHGGPAVLADAAHHDVRVVPWGPSRGAVPLREAKHLATRTIVVGGRLAGTWEVDLGRSEIVTALFAPLSKRAAAALESEGDAALRSFVELGHARSFSLDTDAAVEERAEALRVLARGSRSVERAAASRGPGARAAKPQKAKRPKRGKTRPPVG